MQPDFLDILLIISVFICLASVAYLLIAIIAVERFNLRRQQHQANASFQPAVTILKPVYGLDPEMEENLRSFCDQDYPEFQIVFGLQDENDPAIPIIQALIDDRQDLDISLIIDSQIHGTNHKVSNLINMQPVIKHDYVLVSDSDMRVSRDYLQQVMAPFADEIVGAVTCLYSGSACKKIASSLNAMFINNWFFPSVLISRLLGPMKYCLGATMIVRTHILKKMGGFERLSNYLADDYMLGQCVTELGYSINLSDYVVENKIEEPSIKSMVKHELRWARTLKAVEPLGFVGTFLTDTLVLSVITALVLVATDHLFWALELIGFVFCLRLFLHLRIKHIVRSKNAGSILLIPFRDCLSFFIRIISFTGNTVQWRNHDFSVDQTGVMHEKQQQPESVENADKVPKLITSQDI